VQIYIHCPICLHDLHDGIITYLQANVVTVPSFITIRVLPQLFQFNTHWSSNHLTLFNTGSDSNPASYSLGTTNSFPQEWSDRALKLHPLSHKCTWRCPELGGGAILPFTVNMKAPLNKPRINQPKINNWSVLYSALTTSLRLLLYTHMRIRGRS
jgi:hypothetical protein